MADDIKIVGLANPKRSTGVSVKIVGAIIGIIVLALGVIAGIYLVGEQQDVRERAADQCPEIEACPSGDDPTLLINCTPSEAQSICAPAFQGRLELCGGAQYCCNGSAWTSDLASCAVATPSPSPSPSPTAAPTDAPTTAPTNTSVATPTATSIVTNITTSVPTRTPTTAPASTQSGATAVPIPETGASWPTIIGAGFGVVMILASLILAL